MNNRNHALYQRFCRDTAIASGIDPESIQIRTRSRLIPDFPERHRL
jgi:hypothetical protein